jgi:hypothetical protein
VKGNCLSVRNNPLYLIPFILPHHLLAWYQAHVSEGTCLPEKEDFSERNLKFLPMKYGMTFKF